MTEEIFRNDAYARRCEAQVVCVDEHGIQFDRTVFYPEGGGQPGDSGRLLLADGRELPIINTRKGAQPGEIRHLTNGLPDWLRPGMDVGLEIDWARRYRLMRMHTCLHLLSAVIVAPVTGGQVGDGYGRLDFDLESTPDKDEVAHKLNALIHSNAPVRFRWITDAELDARPELVKTMSVQPPRGLGRVRLVDIEGVDLQPCGGTHVAHIGEIGEVAVTKIDKKGRLNRRVRLEFPAVKLIQT
ncbi:MAG: alanyl-tRNA editing protein [Gammaproteobacteria bacterium]|nr:alanyl-tRNA editing protein [Gammaproteobacteria bacterium]MDE2346433.1 alanyl-tRNA editing protein [Gammaproteobacteria bacterium]